MGKDMCPSFSPPPFSVHLSSSFSSLFSSTFPFPSAPPHHTFPPLHPPTFSHTLLSPLQTLGSLSSRGSTFVYDVPSRKQLEGLQEVMFINDTTDITAEFSLLQSEVRWEKGAGWANT